LQKKQKAQKTQVDPMVLTESDLDEISDKFRDAATEVLQQLEQ